MPLSCLILTLAAAAQAPTVAPAPAVIHRRRLFISPMGESFLNSRGGDALADWFAQADGNHDGVLTLDEMTADASRYFAALDQNHDGEIDPDEMLAYEAGVAPQLHRDANLLGLSEPVASADTNFNRGVSLQEFQAAAQVRFRALDLGHQGRLDLGALERLKPPPAYREKSDPSDRSQQLDPNADSGG